jgi:hypothetical protein
VIFRDQRQTGRIDLEAVEMAMRSALHRAGAAALTELLRFPAPTAEPRTLPCRCGRQAHYRELRTKPVLTAVGPVEVSRPYYGARTVTPANPPPMSNWTSRTRNSLPGCGACRRWWARRPPSITGGNR